MAAAIVYHCIISYFTFKLLFVVSFNLGNSNFYVSVGSVHIYVGGREFSNKATIFPSTVGCSYNLLYQNVLEV